MTENENRLDLLELTAFTVSEFEKVYSWDAWFKSLTLEQLQSTRKAWYQALLRSKGHERQVMTWNLAKITTVIMQRGEENRTGRSVP